MMELTQSERFVSSMTQEAQALLNQFVLDQQHCPARAWEALAELRSVIGQLQELYPFRAFRLRHPLASDQGDRGALDSTNHCRSLRPGRR